MIRFRDVLRNRDFFFLWVGQVVSNFGDRLTQMALVALVYQRNPGSEIALAKLISFTIIPVFVIGPIAGVWVDRLNRKNVMMISDILRGVLILLVPLFIGLNQILPIYLIIFLTFSISRFFIPSKMAIIPDIVTKEKLLVANSLQDATHMIGNVVGLVVAGIIVNIAYIGAVGGFYIDSGTFFVSASFLAMMARHENVKNVKEELITTKAAIKNSLRKSILTEMREGIAYLAGHPNMRFIISVFFLLMAGLGTISCIIIVFIQSAFGTSTRDLGFLGMFLVAGLLIGTLLYAKFGQKIPRRRAIYISFIFSGIFVILFAILVRRFPNLFIAGVISGLLGIAISPITASTTTLTHESIPEEVRGRIFSSLESIIHLAFLVFMFIAAYAAKYIDRFWILVFSGAAFSVCGAVRMGLESKRRAT